MLNGAIAAFGRYDFALIWYDIRALPATYIEAVPSRCKAAFLASRIRATNGFNFNLS
jgi:hypothetical protein